MLVLALDTSTPAVSVALVDGAEARVERVEVANNRHGELLAPLIAESLARGDASPSELGAVVVGLGPGPFTGLRVGVVTARTMADALGIPAYGECSLDAVFPGAAISGGYGVVTDARRRQVYWAAYDETGVRIEGPELSPPAECAAALSERGSRVALGAAVHLYRDDFAGFDLLDEPRYPRPSVLVRRAAGKLDSDAAADSLQPLYLRRPDAVPPGRPKQVTPA